jgi:hypothetical protein
VKTSSAKAKGRRACAELAAALYAHAPSLQPGDIEVTSSGATGEDLKLSPAARKIYPFAIEVKNQEALNIWASLDQAKTHVSQRQVFPLLAFKRNKSEMYVAMSLADFLLLLSRQERL